MSKLKRFNKSNKKYIMPLVALCTVVAIVFAAISYAVYQKTDEIQFINAKVGSFDTSNSDIEIAIMVDGEDVDVPPSKNDGYYNVSVQCDYADGEWDKERWGAVITNISSNRVKCNVSFATPAPTLSDISVTANKTDIVLAYSITGTGEINKTCKYGIEENDLNNDGTITDSGCTLDNLDRGVTYYYEVCVNSSKHEPVCKKGNTTTIPIEKPTISNISASTTTNTITLSYSITGEEITSYTCEYGTSTDYGTTVTASATGCTLSGLSNNTTYYYQICGTNVSGITCYNGSAKFSPQVNYSCTYFIQSTEKKCQERYCRSSNEFVSCGIDSSGRLCVGISKVPCSSLPKIDGYGWVSR